MPKALMAALSTGLALILAPAAIAQNYPVTKTTDTNDGTCDSDCSLREAIIAANANAGPDVITVPAGTYLRGMQTAGEDLSASGDLDITDDVSIVGAGARTTVISASDGTANLSTDRVFDVLGGSVSMSGITISGGRATGDVGGGIENLAMLTLTDVTVAHNKATESGGFGGAGAGIYNEGTLTANGGALSKNTASSNGGGITNYGTVTATNVTVSGNKAYYDGGGVDNEAGTATVTNATIAGNDAGGAVDGTPGAGGGVFNAGSATAKNTIVSGNTTSVYAGGIVTSSPGNCGGTTPATSAGHNIDSGTTCGFAGSGDKPSTDPALGALDDNGGPTDTQAISNTSPAFDSADSAGCPATDQRAIARPQGAACDIGAYEFIVADLSVSVTASAASASTGQPVTYTVTVTNTGTAPADRVRIHSSVTGDQSSSASSPSCDPAYSTCSVSSLPGGASVTVTVTSITGYPASKTMTATETVSARSFDPNSANDSASASVTINPPPPPPPPPPAPKLTLSGPKVQHLKAGFLVVGASCDVTCTPSATVLIKAAKRKLIHLSVRGTAMNGGASEKLKIRLPKPAMKAIAKALKKRKFVPAVIRVTAVGTGGKSTSAVRTVKIVR